MKTINVQYFASLREQRGVGTERIKTTVLNVSRLYDTLRRQYRFTHSKDQLKVAVNDTFVGWGKKIKTGDRVIFIPPMAGG